MVMLEDVKTMPKLEEIIHKEGPVFDLIIIGGGPAGLAAALYAGRAKLKTLLIEKALPGGMASTTYMIENYPGFPEGVSGMDIAHKLESHARKFGCEIYYGEVSKVAIEGGKKIVEIEGKKLEGRALIIASGTQPKKLGVKGEKEFFGRGVSYCATCDGAFYRDKNIAVVGGGNSAVEEAIFLTRYAKKVTIIHRRDKLRADKILAEHAMADPKMFIMWNTILEEISGTKKVEKVTLKNVSSGRVFTIDLDGIFFYVGTDPLTGFLPAAIKKDKEGFIITDKEMKTSVDGIYAAGDVRVSSLKQVVTAVSDGAIAAESARKHIEDLFSGEKKRKKKK